MSPPLATFSARSRLLLALSGAAILESASAHPVSRLEAIRQRGEVLIGVKTDYPPFGMLNAQAEQEGLEYDLARNLAARLGVRLRTVGVNAANRLQVLDEGRADITIATLGDTADRRKISTLVEPDYYASGVTLMTRPDSKINNWTDIRGKTVCASQGSYFNRSMATRYLLNLQTYINGRDAKLALRDGRCEGWLFDNTAIAGDLRQPAWHDYRIKLPPQLITPWAIAIPRAEAGGALDRFIGDIVAQWHRDGTLIALENKWGLAPSIFLARMHSLWQSRDKQGHYLCARQANGLWPPACRNQAFVSPTEVSGFRGWGLRFYAKSGIDLSYLYDDYERRQFFQGLTLTLALTLLCVAGSLICGLALTALCESGAPLFSPTLNSLAQFIRLTPPLMQIYMLVFGLGGGIAAKLAWRPDPFWCVVLTLSLYTGSAIKQTLSPALRQEREKLPDGRTWHRAIQHSSASITGLLVNATKATLLASAVAVPELLSATTAIIAEHGNIATMMNTLMLVYLLLIFAMTRLLRWAELRFCHERA